MLKVSSKFLLKVSSKRVYYFRRKFQHTNKRDQKVWRWWLQSIGILTSKCSEKYTQVKQAKPSGFCGVFLRHDHCCGCHKVDGNSSLHIWFRSGTRSYLLEFYVNLKDSKARRLTNAHCFDDLVVIVIHLYIL